MIQGTGSVFTRAEQMEKPESVYSEKPKKPGRYVYKPNGRDTPSFTSRIPQE